MALMLYYDPHDVGSYFDIRDSLFDIRYSVLSGSPPLPEP